jgi:hypothetical protein
MDNSIQQWTLEKLFVGRPEPLRLFRLVKLYIESLGQIETKVTKTQVSFGAKTKFAWVWLPQLWNKKHPENSIALTFAFDHQLTDPQIVESVEPHPGRWTHHVIIEKDADLDVKVRQWLKEAYEQQEQRTAG